MKRIAIIPARSGSKGLKNKNIIDVCGKPLMAYTIEAACKSNLFDRIIVSTDSIEYGKLTSHEERLSTSLITPILLPSGECLAVVVYIR